jgi:hypothetical protein
MSDISPLSGQAACDQIRERLQLLFPEMTFQVRRDNGEGNSNVGLVGTIRIFGQRTRNMRYDRGNYFASFDIPGATNLAADETSGTDALLRSAVADMEAQLRMRNQ